MTPQDLTLIINVMTLVISIYVLVRTTKAEYIIEKQYEEIKELENVSRQIKR